MLTNYNQFLKEELWFRGQTQDMREINAITDYTILDSNATEFDVIQACQKAIKLNVKSVCVLPGMVKIASKALYESNVLVCTVISFPSGTNSIKEKEIEAKKVIREGADEVDMVLNYPLLLQNIQSKDILVDEILSICKICHSSSNKFGKNVILKVIIESGSLTEDQTRMATQICIEAKADYIKTSTGKTSIGSELNKVKIMYNTIKSSGSLMKIKASGGIRDISQIQQLMPYVDRFGIGYASVDKLNGLSSDSESKY